MRSLLLAIVTATVSSGCAAPGSAIGYLGFSGTVVSPNPKSPLTIEVTLPKHYGLGDLDHFFGKPEDYGHRDRTVTIPVSSGMFTVEFAPVIYHITFWLLPPLGAFPRNPPAPAYFVSFSDALDEVYLVGMNREQFEYRVFERASRRPKPKTEAVWTISDGSYLLVESGEKKVWHLRMKVTKPNRW